jgi:amino acid transporter
MMLETLRTYLRPRRHTALLIAIIATIAVRPLIGDVGAAPLVFSIALLVLMLFSLYTIQIDDLVGEREVLLAQRRRRSIIGWVLAAVGLAERVGTLVAPSPQLYKIGVISWFLFFAFVTVTELRSLLKQKEVTSETISMSISVYLLLGLTWGLLYVVIFALQPQAFSFGSSPAPVLVSEQQNVGAVFIYFSLTTLSTIGFGDITPVSMQARYAAVAEGITGQFYLAILVARLVGMQMSRAAEKSVERDR